MSEGRPAFRPSEDLSIGSSVPSDTSAAVEQDGRRQGTCALPESFWANCRTLLMIQRGDEDARLVKYLERDPTIGLPADVRVALLSAAHSLAPEMVDLELESIPILAADDEGYADAANFRAVRRMGIPRLFRAEVAGDEFRPSPTLQSFLTDYPFLDPRFERAQTGEDIHYAERLFFNRVLYPVLGDAGLRRLTPQRRIQDEHGRERFLDFELSGTRTYALEVEGAAFHDRDRISTERFTNEKRRQRTLSIRGYEYFPFSYHEIVSGSALEVFQDLCRDDPWLEWVARQSGYGGSAPSQGGTGDRLEWLLTWAPRAFTQAQRAMLPLVASWVDAGRRTIRITEAGPEIGIATVAIADLLTFIEQVAALVGIPVQLPDVEITATRRDGEIPPLLKDLLDSYFGPGFTEHGRDQRLDRSTASVSWQLATSVPAEYAELTLALEGSLSSQTDADAALTLADLRDVTAPGWAASRDLLAPYRTRQPSKRTLDYFARRFFQIPHLRSEQVEVITSLISGRSRLVILPTSFGKSVCYQLPALLVPGVLLVISPLKALIRDQVESLLKLGLTAIGSVTSSDSSAQKDEYLRQLRAGRYRLFYISPERIQIQRFALEIEQSASEWGAWALAVDEAHCISEWGHDFRPAYLQLGRFRRELTGRNGAVPVLALTATASSPVKQDICHVLDITEEPVTLASVDRPEISLSVYPVSEIQGKPEQLPVLLNRDVAKALSQTTEELFRGPPYSAGMVIFTIYADPHGRHRYHQGIGPIRESLIGTSVLGEHEVAVHSSTPPRRCPRCESHSFVIQSSKTRGKNGLKHECLSCGHKFDDASMVDPTAWDRHISDTQDRFKEDHFPVLVATKGYGMGIDKRNIRAVVHFAFSGGLESYYQEVGRAGRDKKQAHAALLFTPPAAGCAEDLARVPTDRAVDGFDLFEPACVKDQYRKFWTCPYGLVGLCDYGMQARNISESYPGEEKDVLDVTDVFKQLTEGGRDRVRKIVVRDREEDSTRFQVSLYRLQQIGVIEDYTLEYSHRGRVTFHVRVARRWDFEIGQSILERALEKLILSDDAIRRNSLHEEVDGLVAPDSGSVSDAIRVLLEVLIKRTYRAVKQMRYRSLYAHLEYASVAPGRGCRRAILQRTFGEAVREDAACGFCDGCQPDLSFTGRHANIPAADATLELLSRELPSLLSQFDPPAIERAVSIARESNALGSLQGKAEFYLESDVGSIAAYAVAGIAARLRGRTEEALRHFTGGYLQNQVDGRSVDRAAYLYRLASEIDPLRALDLPDRIGGIYDTAAGRTFLHAEMMQAATLVDAERIEVMEGILACDEFETFAESTLTGLQEAARSLLSDLMSID